MNSLRSTAAGRLLRREYRRLRDVERRGRVALRLFARTALPAGAPGRAARKDFLVVPGAGYQPGLFSQFATVLGLLEHVERWRDRYAGLRVDFAEQGLYYDPPAGPNWWNYYFEPLALGSAAEGRPRVLSDDELFYFARRVERTMPRERGFALIDRYIRPRRDLRDKVDAYVRANFDGAFVVGIHYRGTDKFEDAPRVPYGHVHAAVLAAIAVARRDRFRLFVATDEQAFRDYVMNLFPGKVHCLEMYRSADGRPIDVTNDDGNYKKGQNAVLDCLLLSRCDYLVRTASNLSLCSTLFNPGIPIALLNRET
jgi:hypothetical protein